MRIKIVRVSNKSNYTLKIMLILIVIMILFRYFCNHKNVKASKFLNTAKYKDIMNTEISLMSFFSKKEANIMSDNSLPLLANISGKFLINDEMSYIKEVNSKLYNENLEKQSEAVSTQSQAIENSQIADSLNNNEHENINEPEIRTKHRSLSISNSRQIYI